MGCVTSRELEFTDSVSHNFTRDMSNTRNYNPFEKICNKKEHDNRIMELFKPLRISTINANIDHSINKYKKIDNLINYFFTKRCNYQLDVLCLQNIQNISIINQFKYFSKTYYPNEKIYFYPDTSSAKYTSSIPNNDICLLLIISRHVIITSAEVSLNNTNLMNMQMANINFRGDIISVYNVCLANDIIGTSNKNLRKQQIDKLLSTMIENSKNVCNNKHVYKNLYNKNIQILCGTFYIKLMRKYMKHNSPSDKYLSHYDINEYDFIVKGLNLIDTHKLMHLCLNDNNNNNKKNKKFLYNSSIFLHNPDYDKLVIQKMLDYNIEPDELCSNIFDSNYLILLDAKYISQYNDQYDETYEVIMILHDNTNSCEFNETEMQILDQEPDND